MWPWEHLFVGYLCYSVYVRVVHRERPGNEDAAVLALATQAPDLIDKPLAWSLGILPSGLSLGHSLLFAVPVCLLVAAVGWVAGRPAIGRAYAIGHLSHLVGDVFYNTLTSGSVTVGFLFWPLVRSPPVGSPGFLVQVRLFVSKFVAFLSTPTGRLYLVFELALVGAVVALWVADRYPGLALLRRGVRRVGGAGRR